MPTIQKGETVIISAARPLGTQSCAMVRQQFPTPKISTPAMAFTGNWRLPGHGAPRQRARASSNPPEIRKRLLTSTSGGNDSRATRMPR